MVSTQKYEKLSTAENEVPQDDLCKPTADKWQQDEDLQKKPSAEPPLGIDLTRTASHVQITIGTHVLWKVAIVLLVVVACLSLGAAFGGPPGPPPGGPGWGHMRGGPEKGAQNGLCGLKKWMASARKHVTGKPDDRNGPAEDDEMPPPPAPPGLKLKLKLSEVVGKALSTFYALEDLQLTDGADCPVCISKDLKALLGLVEDEIGLLCQEASAPGVEPFCKLHISFPNITSLIAVTEAHVDPISLATARCAAAGPCSASHNETSELVLSLSNVNEIDGSILATMLQEPPPRGPPHGAHREHPRGPPRGDQREHARGPESFKRHETVGPMDGPPKKESCRECIDKGIVFAKLKFEKMLSKICSDEHAPPPVKAACQFATRFSFLTATSVFLQEQPWQKALQVCTCRGACRPFPPPPPPGPPHGSLTAAAEEAALFAPPFPPPPGPPGPSPHPPPPPFLLAVLCFITFGKVCPPPPPPPPPPGCPPLGPPGPFGPHGPPDGPDGPPHGPPHHKHEGSDDGPDGANEHGARPRRGLRNRGMPRQRPAWEEMPRQRAGSHARFKWSSEDGEDEEVDEKFDRKFDGKFDGNMHGLEDDDVKGVPPHHHKGPHSRFEHHRGARPEEPGMEEDKDEAGDVGAFEERDAGVAAGDAEGVQARETAAKPGVKASELQDNGLDAVALLLKKGPAQA